MNPRTRRLGTDAQHLRNEFAGHPHVEVEALGWDPPEQYRVTYRLPGITIDDGGSQPRIAREHRVLITLPSGYPRQKPHCTSETPVFHPNFGQRAGDEVCIGDYWTPTQSLADIIVKIGEMVQYREYNLGSALNAVAGRWAAENTELFPIGDIELYQAEPQVTLAPGNGPAPVRLVLSPDDAAGDAAGAGS